MNQLKYTPPSDSLVAVMVNGLDDVRREDFEERSAIIEFDAGISRAHAECLALLNILKCYPSLLIGVTAFQIDMDGATNWVLTASPATARDYLVDIGALVVAEVNLSDVIHERYGEVAMLCHLG